MWLLSNCPALSLLSEQRATRHLVVYPVSFYASLVISITKVTPYDQTTHIVPRNTWRHLQPMTWSSLSLHAQSLSQTRAAEYTGKIEQYKDTGV